MIRNKNPVMANGDAELTFDAALERVSDFSSGDAENAAHIAIIRALWNYIPSNARAAAASEISDIIAESEGIRY